MIRNFIKKEGRPSFFITFFAKPLVFSGFFINCPFSFEADSCIIYSYYWVWRDWLGQRVWII